MKKEKNGGRKGLVDGKWWIRSLQSVHEAHTSPHQQVFMFKLTYRWIKIYGFENIFYCIGN